MDGAHFQFETVWNIKLNFRKKDGFLVRISFGETDSTFAKFKESFLGYKIQRQAHMQTLQEV